MSLGEEKGLFQAHVANHGQGKPRPRGPDAQASAPWATPICWPLRSTWLLGRPRVGSESPILLCNSPVMAGVMEKRAWPWGWNLRQMLQPWRLIPKIAQRRKNKNGWADPWPPESALSRLLSSLLLPFSFIQFLVSPFLLPTIPFLPTTLAHTYTLVCHQFQLATCLS